MLTHQAETAPEPGRTERRIELASLIEGRECRCGTVLIQQHEPAQGMRGSKPGRETERMFQFGQGRATIAKRKLQLREAGVGEPKLRRRGHRLARGH